MLDDLRLQVCEANKALTAHGLVTLTFGNVSGIDRERGIVAIKPSGLPYEALTPNDIVLLDLDGETVAGTLRPSSDAVTHVILYREFPAIGGVVHAHSTYATAFAQAQRALPCLGTTHADHFRGEVPVTRPLIADETAQDYEANTGRVIVERFRGMDPMQMPAVLVANHGPFTWGSTVATALENAVALEAVAKTAYATLALAPETPPVSGHLLDKHFQRKHGSTAYYGQEKE